MNILLDCCDRLVRKAVPLAGPEEKERWEKTLESIRRQLIGSGNTLLVGLIGGTGVGKTSLLNALVGQEIGETSPRRPTTSVPLGLLPIPTEDNLTSWLEGLGVEVVSDASLPTGLGLVDLPDLDSIKVGHRETAELLLGQLNGLIWVLDPEKYQDRRWWNDLLPAELRVAPRNLFVLNKSDRLTPSQTRMVMEDLRRTLSEFGLGNQKVIATSSDPETGPPQGIAELWEAIRTQISDFQLGTQLVLSRVDALVAEVTEVLRLDQLDELLGWEKTVMLVGREWGTAPEQTDVSVTAPLDNWWREVETRFPHGNQPEAIKPRELINQAVELTWAHTGEDPRRRSKRKRWWQLLRLPRTRQSDAVQVELFVQNLRKLGEPVVLNYLGPYFQAEAARREWEMERSRYQLPDYIEG